MKKIIALLTIVIFSTIIFASCDSGYFVDRDGTHHEKGIKRAIEEHLEYNVLVPSSLKIESIYYSPAQTIYEADAEYRAINKLIEADKHLLSEAKTKREKKTWQDSIERLSSELDEYLSYHYSAKKLSDDVYNEPIKAWKVRVSYSAENAYGQRLEADEYYNIVQVKATVKRSSDGKICTVYDYEIHDSDILMTPLADNDCKSI